MLEGIELEGVRRNSGGRVHLVPHVPGEGAVVTLCDQTLAPGTFRAADGPADCRNCLRRRDDPARVSGAFFRSDLGADLLQRSLEQARLRRSEPPARTTAAPPPPRRPPARPRPPAVAVPEAPQPPSGPAASEPEPLLVAPELRAGPQLRRAFENVYLSPDGVMIRVTDGHVGHVTFSGPVDVRSRNGVLTIRLGDVVLEFELR